jgi:thioredoxin 2
MRPMPPGSLQRAAGRSLGQKLRKPHPAKRHPGGGRLLAQWCGPCKVMAPIYERVCSEFEPDVRFLKVDTEIEPALAARYNIRSIPTLMLFQKGNVVAQQAGALDTQTLRSWLRRHTAPSEFQTR